MRSRVATARARAADHPRHLALFGLVAGLLLGPVSPPALIVAALLGAWLGRRPGVALLAAGAVLAGGVAAAERLAGFDGGRLGAAIGERHVGPVTILEPVRVRPDGRRTVRVRLGSGPARGETAVARVGAGAGWPAAGVGDVVEVRGALAALTRLEAHHRRRGAGAAIVVEAARQTGLRRPGPAGDLDAIRRRAERALSAGLAPAQGGLLRGMVLGQDEGIAEPVREEFRRSGLAHLLAASGSNVMLLATLAIAVATGLGAGLRGRLGVALVLIALYVPLAGAGPSIQRAGVMGAAGLVAALAGRPAHRWYALGLAAAVTLAVDPRAAGDPGWQLSFAAVVALLALAPGLRGWLEARGSPGLVADATAITLAATIGTAPLMALHFDAVSLVSLPANLLAAPAVAPVMWLGTIAAAVGQVSAAAAGPVAALAAYPVAYVEWVAHATAALPSASVGARLPGVGALALAYAVLAAAVLVVRTAGRRAREGPRRAPGRAGLLMAGAGLAACAVIAGAASAPPARAPGELVVSFLDVGQGDAILLQRDETAVLIDTGPAGGPILERLREAGVGRLDVLLLTHAQNDHEGMAVAVLRAHRTRLVLNGGAGARTPTQHALPLAAARAGARVAPARAGERVRLGPLELRMLWPPPPVPGVTPADADPNLRAVVSHVRLGDFDLLLLADAESEVTGPLDLPRAEVLKVAHHGSADAGLPTLLERVRPRIAAIPVGAGNAYGHPAPSTLAALRAVPGVLRTDRHGTVRLRVSSGRIRVERSG